MDDAGLSFTLLFVHLLRLVGGVFWLVDLLGSLPCGLPPGFLLLISAGYRSQLKFRMSGRCMMSGFSLFIQFCDADAIERSLDSGAVHDAWLAWSSAAESVVVLAFVESGGPIPGGGLARGRGSARFRSVALGGPLVHRFRTDILTPLLLLRFICTRIILLYICLI